MRLTKAVSGRGGKYLVDLLDIQVVADKLGLLEDIEEEIGMDLATFYRFAIKGDPSIVIYLKDGGIIQNQNIHLGADEAGRYIRDEYDIVRKYYFKDYGKTWAFTREELEDD